MKTLEDLLLSNDIKIFASKNLEYLFLNENINIFYDAYAKDFLVANLVDKVFFRESDVDKIVEHPMFFECGEKAKLKQRLIDFLNNNEECRMIRVPILDRHLQLSTKICLDDCVEYGAINKENQKYQHFFNKIKWDRLTFNIYKDINPEGKTFLPKELPEELINYFMNNAWALDNSSESNFLTPARYERLCLEYVINRGRYIELHEDILVPLKLPKKFYNFGAGYAPFTPFYMMYKDFIKELGR